MASSTGMKIEARHKFGAPLPEAAPGEHLWTVTGMWTVKDPTAEQVLLDIENLITLAGPGCFICEQGYAQAIAGGPCPGEPPSGRAW